jgi:O-antigen/teichoic acid export membrane protein
MNFLKKSIINIFFTGCLGAVNLFAGIILSRCLGPEGIGQYQLAVSSSTILAALWTLGIGGSVIYFINQKMDSTERITTVSLKFSVLAGLLAWAVFSMMLGYERYFGPITGRARIAMGFYACLQVIITTVWPILMADLQVVRYQLVALAPRIGLLAGILGLLLSAQITLGQAWLMTALTQSLGLILTVWFLRGKITLTIPMNWALVRQMAGYGLKLNLSYIVLLLNAEIGLLLIRALVAGDFSEVGFYRNAVSIAAMGLLLVHSIGPMLFARWTGAEEQEKQRQVELVSRVFCFGSVVGLTLFAFLSKPLILLLYGDAFFPSIAVFRLMLVGIGAQFLYNFLFRLFSASGKPLYTSAVLTFNLIVMGILMVVLVPPLKACGAAVAYSIGNLFGLVMTYYWAATRFHIRLKQCFLIQPDDFAYLYRMIRH